MKLSCTKILLDKIKETPVALPEKGGLYDWHANLVDFDSIPGVVMVNDMTLFTVVIFNITAEESKNLAETAKSAIRDTLLEECVNEEIVNKYIEDLGEVEYAKTADRSMRAYLASTTRNIWYFLGNMENGFHRGQLGRATSHYPLGKNSDGKRNDHRLRDALEEVYGKPILSCRAVKLKCSIDIEGHTIDRTFTIPLRRTLDELHRTLQVIFQWKSYHMHEFQMYSEKEKANELLAYGHKDGYRLLCKYVNSKEDMQLTNQGKDITELDWGVRLSDLESLKMKYVYDFGDYWEHYIEFVEIIEDFHKNHPVLDDWNGFPVPEDCGGSSGYNDLVQILSDPEHEDYAETKTWAEGMDYGKFDPELVNRILRSIGIYM